MTDHNEIIRKLMAARGITAPEDIEEYLSDHPKRTYDPFLMKNMQEGTDLVLQEAKKGTRICVYGDYDADGVTSVCILHTVLAELTDNLTWYIPSRFTEGYGLHKEAIDTLHADGVGLIITVDCGITSNAEVEHAKSLGIRMLVTDHHSVGDELPACLCIDPKQDGETYPFRELAGCGVAFKLLQAIQRQAGLPRSLVNEVLDLVGTGTVADIVPLVDENRTIVKYGLHKLNEKSRASLAALEKAISLGTITSGNISFGIAPHINAAGRMKHAKEAVRLILANPEDRRTIDAQVACLISCNAQRKKLQEQAFQKCQDQISGDEPMLCLRVDGIQEGITGNVASHLQDYYHCPVILATPGKDGLLKGSGRGIRGIDLFRLLDGHREAFARVGGHARACGFTISEENFRELKPLLIDEVRSMYEADPAILAAGRDYDLEAEPGDINEALTTALDQMEPFGEGNPQPRFLLKDVRLQYLAYMGENEIHARFIASQGDQRVSCVLFRKAQEYKEQLEGGRPISLIGTASAQVWNGRTRVQLIVEEII